MVGINIKVNESDKLNGYEEKVRVILESKIKNETIRKMICYTVDMLKSEESMEENNKYISSFLNEYADDSLIIFWKKELLDLLIKYLNKNKVDEIIGDRKIIILKDKILSKMYVEDNIISLMTKNNVNNIIDLYYKLSVNSFKNENEIDFYTISNKNGEVVDRVIGGDRVKDILIYYGMFEQDYSKLINERYLETECYAIKIEKTKIM